MCANWCRNVLTCVPYSMFSPILKSFPRKSGCILENGGGLQFPPCLSHHEGTWLSSGALWCVFFRQVSILCLAKPARRVGSPTATWCLVVCHLGWLLLVMLLLVLVFIVFFLFVALSMETFAHHSLLTICLAL